MQERLAAVAAQHTDLSVAVIYNGTASVTAIRVLEDKQVSNDEYGQGGSTMGRFRVSAEDMPEPEYGSKMMVDGVQVYVMGARISGGVRVVDYSETDPVTGT